MNIIVAVLVGIIAVAVCVFLVATFAGGDTYVRIVDTSSVRALDSSAPGADIDGVSIEKHKNGEVVKAWYAHEIISWPYSVSTPDTVSPAFADPLNALGDPAADESPKYISINGGELTVRIPKRLRNGYTITVHEVGAENTISGDTYEVFTSKTPDGPWESRGTGSGPKTFEIIK